jgi:hypothetical protein
MSIDLDALRSVDLAAAGKELLTFIDTADPCFVALLVGLVNLVGWKIAALHPAVRSWGIRLAVAVFLIHGGYQYVSQGGLEARDLPRAALRSFVAAGLLLAPLLIVVPILAFVYGRLRLALAAALLYGGYAVAVGEMSDPDAAGTVGLRCLVAAGLALVVAWIVQPLVDFVKARRPAPSRDAAERDVAERRARGRSQRRTADSGGVAAKTQRRRRRVRLRARLLRALQSSDLITRSERRELWDLVRRILAATRRPAEWVAVESPPRPSLAQIGDRPHGGEPSGDLAELTRWFLAEHRRIQALGDRERASQLAALNQRYQQLAEHLLERTPA